jgi:hypothetical protein
MSATVSMIKPLLKIRIPRAEIIPKFVLDFKLKNWIEETDTTQTVTACIIQKERNFIKSPRMASKRLSLPHSLILIRRCVPSLSAQSVTMNSKVNLAKLKSPARAKTVVFTVIKLKE